MIGTSNVSGGYQPPGTPHGTVFLPIRFAAA